MAFVIPLLVLTIQGASGLRLSGTAFQEQSEAEAHLLANAFEDSYNPDPESDFKDWSFKRTFWLLPHKQRFSKWLEHDANNAMEVACEGGEENYQTEGDWPVCKSNPPMPADCVIYSFGLGGDMEYENYRAENGCEVHGFDPTIELRQIHQELIMDKYKAVKFHFMGVTSENEHPDNVQQAEDNYDEGGYGKVDFSVLKPLPQIMQEMGHDYIHVLKMDCEGCEWGVFLDLTPEFLANKVGDILMETHFRSQTMTPTAEAYKNLFHKILATRKVQWRHPNSLVKPNSTITQELLDLGLPDDACCVEYSFVKTDEDDHRPRYNPRNKAL